MDEPTHGFANSGINWLANVFRIKAPIGLDENCSLAIKVRERGRTLKLNSGIQQHVNNTQSPREETVTDKADENCRGGLFQFYNKWIKPFVSLSFSFP